MIFEVTKSLPLSHIAYEIFGEQKQFVTATGENIAATTLVCENASQEGINSISYKNLE
jgi:hypothetical protein